MNVDQRNKFAAEFVSSKLDEAEGKDIGDFSGIKNFDKLQKILDDLIWINARGFRGIVLTAIVGLEIDSSYDPLSNFYSCNPRSIFEKGIYFALKGRVPSGKSDPLNVAKNTNNLNKDWATGKRPEKAALAVVFFS